MDIRSLESMEIAKRSEVGRGKHFGEWLISHNLLTDSTLSTALNEQNLRGGRLGEVLSKLKILTEKQITSSLADYLQVERFQLDDIAQIDFKVARIVPENIAKRFCLLAISEYNGSVIVAMADPLDVIARDVAAHKLKKEVKIVISSRQEINHALEAVYHGSDVEEQHLRDLVQTTIHVEDGEIETEVQMETVADIRDEEAANKAPVIRFVDLLLSQAVKSRASDIHIEPQEQTMKIRMRIDGLLREMIPPPRKMQAAVIARTKILAAMDIAERRLPQDGRFKIKAPGREIDVRASVIPTIYGEKVVLRILDKTAVNHNLDELGFERELLDKLKNVLSLPYGIIIVTGPTGSGKSTTLYSALNFLKNPHENITTVENPVEYRLGGINQVQVKPEIGLDFANCLRSILRQDPDIIMIGEIRDKETVEIAIKASLTGHLVLSTFHTNDAPSALSRLIYMGIERYLLASTLNMVVAQRLVRKICEHCKESYEPSAQVLKSLQLDSTGSGKILLYRSSGCKYCDGTGFSGRLPIFEFLPMDNSLREKITDGATEAQIRALARSKGYKGLWKSGINRMLDGLTTAEEVLRVTFAEESGWESDSSSPE